MIPYGSGVAHLWRLGDGCPKDFNRRHWELTKSILFRKELGRSQVGPIRNSEMLLGMLP